MHRWECTFSYVAFTVVSTNYKTRSEVEDVILGNDALLKCKVPSFVSDIVQVVGWIDVETGKELIPHPSNFNNSMTITFA